MAANVEKTPPPQHTREVTATGAVQQRTVDEAAVRDADRTGPELVMFGLGSPNELLECVARRRRITRLTDDPDESVLGNCAGCPPMPNLLLDPRACSAVLDVVAVEQPELGR